MLCDNCKQNNANVKYTQVINGVKKEMHLCEECANKLGISDISFNMPISFSNFLEDVFDDDTMLMPDIVKPKTLLCDSCNMSYDEFLKDGKFGCENCYDAFENKIDSLLKNIHGVNRHVGRVSNKIEKTKKINEVKTETKEQEVKRKAENKKEEKINELKERLKLEIKEEKYEDAAKTRDEIKKLEK